MTIVQIALWSSLDDGHSVVEYYSEVFGKFVYYDPLYGAMLLDDRGEPASLEDVLDQIAKFGFRIDGAYDRWEFRPVRFSGASTTAPAVAADSRYESYNTSDYGQVIIRNYMSIIARRFTDYTHVGLPLPGENVVMGRWLVFDNTAFTEFASYFSQTFWPAFEQQYDVRNGGHYEITVVRSAAH
jgi:hypothetical protein